MPKNDEPRELNPISWMSDDPELDENLYDFRAIPETVLDEEDEVEGDPKASDAPESANSSASEPEQVQEIPAPVEKDSPPKATEPSTQTSSDPTKDGKVKQPA